ncbi:MAG: V-type ATPase subunit [bacterium]|nr:V-type ATPase subunit [bacterium]
MKYDYQIGIIRAKEDDLLSFQDWSRLLAIPSLRDVWAELVRLDIGFTEVGELELSNSISKFYSKNIKNLYSELCAYFFDDTLKKAFLYEVDIYNLKLIYKQKIFNKNFSESFIPSGFYVLSDLVEEKWINFKDEFFLELREEIVKQSLTPFDFDILADSKLFEFRLLSDNNKFLQSIWKTKIDFYNLKIFFAKNKAFLRGGNIDNWMLSHEELIERFPLAKFALANDSLNWEKEEEYAILRLSQDTVVFFETLEPLVAYFFKRYIEIKNINRLLYGRAFKLPSSKIEDQLSIF